MPVKCRTPFLIIPFIATLFIALTLPANVPAAAPVTSASEIDYPPFSFVTAAGQVDGFSVELLRAALAAMGRDVVFASGTWNEVRKKLETGEIQALPLVGRTPEREALFDFTFPYMSLHGAIVIRDERMDIRNMDDLRGLCVAVMRGDNAEEFLRRKERGIDIVTTTTFEDALHLLSRGECDAVVMQRLVALRLLQETGIPDLTVVDRPVEEFRQDFSFAVTEGDRDTLALLNEGLALVIADGTYRHLHAKWFAALELPTRQRLIVGGDASFPPYEYLDERRLPTGFITELTRAIAVEAGLDVEIRLGSWDAIVRQLEEGDIDIIQGIFYSPERDLTLDFTPPHLVAHYVSAVRDKERPPPATFEELKNLRLVAQRGDAIVEVLRKHGLAEGLTLVDSQEDALRQLLDNQYDCALVTRLPALYLLKNNDWSGVRLGNTPLLEREYAYAVTAGQQALLAKLSEGLQVLQHNGEYRRIHDKWLAQYQQPTADLVTVLRYSALIVLPIVLVLLLIVLWNWSLRRQAEKKHQQLFAEMLSGFALHEIICDDAGKPVDYRYLLVNPAFEQMTGLSAAQVVGRRVLELLPATEGSWIETYGKVALTGESKLFENYSTELDKYFEVNAFQSKPGQFACIFSDITARKKAEQQLIRKNEEMEQFVYSVSHDLKSPLLTIKTFSGLLQQHLQSADEERITKDAGFIRDAAARIEQLLEALLRLSRVGRMDNPAVTIAMDKLVDECLGALAGSITRDQVDIVKTDFPLLLHGDRMQLGQIWQNLIENAMKYRGDQDRLRIEIGVEEKTGGPVFYVRDNGMGIEPQQLQRIFTIFTQLDPQSSGSGLGLALVKKVVELYDGNVWAESEGKGKGSCFRFTLPKALKPDRG